MRSFRTLVVTFVCSLLCLSSVWASNSEKIYIPKSAIEFTQDSIFIHVGDDAIPVETIHVDEDGFFIYEAALLAKPVGGWTCPKCNFKNADYLERCYKCGWPS